MNVGRYLFFVFCLSVLHSWVSGEANENTLSMMNPKKDWSRFFNKLNVLCDMDTFVESGTYLGHTSAKAALCFDSVHTVELNDDFYRKSTEYLKGYPNVHIYHGNTSTLFHELIPQLARKEKCPVFWLDGHFMSCMSDLESGINSVLVEEYTPILKELHIIKKSSLKKAILLIDDVRLFGTLLNNTRIECAGNKHYPLLSEVGTILNDSGFCFQIVGDILLGYTPTIHLQFSPIIKACTVSRLYDGANYDLEDILTAEKLIASAQREELDSIRELFQAFSMPWRAWYNKSPHYNLWYGLALRNNRQYKDASSQFQEVINLGYNHWRIFWYLADSLHQEGDVEGAMAALERARATCADFEHAKVVLQKLSLDSISHKKIL